MVDPMRGLGRVQDDDVSLISMFHGLRKFLDKLKQLAVYHIIAFFKNHAVQADMHLI